MGQIERLADKLTVNHERGPNRGKLRILMATPRYFPFMGGVENHVHQVARRLARTGTDVTILTADSTGQLIRSEEMDGVKIMRVRAWPAGRDYNWAPEIYRVIGSGAWDLVHVQSYHTLFAPLAMLASLRARIPYILTFHGGGSSSRLRQAARPAQLALLRPLLARAERLIAVAEFEIDQFSRRLRLAPARFALIPNGADLEYVPSRHHAGNGETIIASLGRLERYKGHHRILAALPAILRDRPDARLWIVGTGPFEKELREQAIQLGVADRVDIFSIPIYERQSMGETLARVSLVVLLSDYETQPLAILEALYLGCPALVAETSGLLELVRNGLARGVPADSSPQQVAAAVTLALRARAVPPRASLPTWDECAANLSELYKTVTRDRVCAS